MGQHLETKKSQAIANLLILLLKMARPERFELPTTWFEARYSIQLSYGRFSCEQ